MDNWITTIKIAHRGLHNNIYPENSLGAFENACRMGFAIELDVRKIQDGNIIVFHDDNLQRTCNTDIKVETLISSDLKNYNLFNTNYIIPSLKEVLQLVNGRVPLLIEIKNHNLKHRIAPNIYNIIKDYSGAVAIKSFNPLEVMWFKRHAPHITRGMLACGLNDVKLPRAYKFLVKHLSLYKLTRPHFISYCYRDLPNKYILHKKVPILTWTIHSSITEAQALQLADNIIFEGYTPEQSHIGV